MRRIIIVFAVTTAVMLFVFQGADWYANSSSIPRYCSDPDGTLERVHKILIDEEPVGGDPKREYIIAAKLIFLVPQEEGEAIDSYLPRVRERIMESCGEAY